VLKVDRWAEGQSMKAIHRYVLAIGGTGKNIYAILKTVAILCAIKEIIQFKL
jgi:hypothetical protein